jgi:MFS family permease
VRPSVRGAGTAHRRSLGRPFGCLWTAYAVSAFGTSIGFNALTLIAILVLGADTTEVSVLAAAGLAAGAAVAVPLGPWVEFRRKRPVMIAMDLIRFAALMSVPAAYASGRLGFAQLLTVSIVVAAAGIASRAAAGAYLKTLVRPEDLLVANGRFEATTWTATALGPPLGGAAIGLFGPVATVVADAVSYLLSAAGIRAIGGTEPRPVRAETPRLSAGSPGRRADTAGPRADAPGHRAGDLLDGWRYILAHPALRRLFLNTVLVNGLIMAASPLVAVLMLGRLGFEAWQYGLAFGLPCVGGLIGSRLASRFVARYGQREVMWAAGALRACWPVALALIHPGGTGLVLVIVVELGLITCVGVFNPVFATYRLEQVPAERVARTLSAWSVTSNVTIAAMTALWGLLAGGIGPRAAIAVAGALILMTPFLLPRPESAPRRVPDPARIRPSPSRR